MNMTIAHMLHGVSGLTRYAMSLIVVVGLAGCVSYVGIHSDKHMAQSSDYSNAQSLPTEGGTWPPLDWPAHFGDSQLPALIDEAVASSPTLAEAQARIDKASSYVEQVNATTLPQVDARYSSARELLSGNTILPPPVGGHWFNENNALVSASYELDVWGRNREALRSSTSEQKATIAEAQQARLILVASVAHSYNRLALLYALRDIAKHEVVSRKNIGQLTDIRVSHGLDNEVESRTVEVNVAASQTDVAELDGEITVTRYQLAALLGDGPDRGPRITRPTLSAAVNLVLPTQLSADLLSRRPDLVAAHWRVDAATHDIKVAKADFFPNINLNAAVGLDTFGFGKFFDSQSRQVQAGPAIHLPLFDGGALRAQLKDRYADYDTSVASYNQTLINALRDVATQIVTIQATDAQIVTAKHASDASRRAYELALIRYKAGLDPQLQVLSADLAQLTQSQRLTMLQMQRLDTQISLYEALGGGFDTMGTPLASTKKQIAVAISVAASH